MKKKKISKNTLLFLLLLAAIAARIFLGVKMGTWFPSGQYYDDALLAKYAMYPDFSTENPLSLLKMMGFPIFLRMVSITPFSYPLIVSLLWVFVALLAKSVAKHLETKPIYSWFVFFYFLFFPTAFDTLMGTRLYRNSILTPFYMMVFLLFLYIGIHIIQRKYKSIGFYISHLLLGLFFTWTYFIKEDGQWLLACLFFFIAFYGILILYQIFKYKQMKYFILIPLLCIPLGLFKVGENLYLNHNEQTYGIRYIQTRTDGQFGQFVNRVYKIQSNKRTTDIWAPHDAIVKAFKASPTLSKHPELLEAIETSHWVQGDITKTPIQGDFLTWTLRDALVDAKLWTTQKEVDTFFKKVNKEIDSAFEKGKLKKDTRFQIVSSAGGKTNKEMKDLRTLIKMMMHGHIRLYGYGPGAAPTQLDSKKLSSSIAAFINTPYLKDNTVNGKKLDYDTPNFITLNIFRVYRIINPILLIIFVLSVILTTIEIFLNKKKILRNLQLDPNRYYSYLMSIALFGITIVYAFCIAWFVIFVYHQSEGMHRQYWLNFYSIGLPALLSLVYMLGLRTFSVYGMRFIKLVKRRKKQSNRKEIRQ